MYELRRSAEFDRWLARLSDRGAVARVLVRLDRLARGNPGDVRPVGFGVSELRIDHGPGLRVYYLQHGGAIVLLLCGGDKSTQSRDIRRAHRVAEQWRGEKHDD
ncbi:type II toxin-antitoxin system RelE/ParE family toxin [Microcella humidisoli]|uniref:Type II toxin-antitoxin system RelE/ParE family toxin n=1 Tax=Microcella humidisoli TaxID=2963406 RepID=A0ABY5FWC2_9MICO|nr:type II toxin-antitoxin system RelE/ParE family toxin [Microcella humidisoli]UTT62579.1 type II toxin-antitoxin system RelE/ParE family toxin [Microcella humidisoli]